MLPTMRKDAVFVDLTTASAEIARELYAQGKQRGSPAKSHARYRCRTSVQLRCGKPVERSRNWRAEW
jgi:hypothetical protein